MVVCTDGAWDVMSEEDVVAIVIDAQDRWDACCGGPMGSDGGVGNAKCDEAEAGEGGKIAGSLPSPKACQQGQQQRPDWVARVLTHEALVRGTRDNVACLFVDHL